MTDGGLPSPLWLSHDWPGDYDRCVRIGRHHVCRRCSVLYPVAVVTAALAYTTSTTPAWPVVVLPAPAVAEFVAEHLGLVRHRPLRLVALSTVAAIGLGVGFARYFSSYADPVFWLSVIGWCAVGVVGAFIGARRTRSADSA